MILPRLPAVLFTDDEDQEAGAKIVALHQAKLAKYPAWVRQSDGYPGLAGRHRGGLEMRRPGGGA